MVVATRTVPAEERFVLNCISWETYESILADHESSSAPRFVYDHGVLEIMSPLPEHERMNTALRFVATAAASAHFEDFEDLGSTTFRRADLDRGFEADGCFYFQHVDGVRGKTRIDPLVDPPPDLVIEIDMTRSSLNKLAIFAEFGVPEVWRYTASGVQIHVLVGDAYVRRAESSVLPGVTDDALNRLTVKFVSARRRAWLREVEAWAATLPT